MRTTTTTPSGGIEVFDVESGLGGHFTVSIIQTLEDGMVMVRIWHGRFTDSGWTSYGLFDGKTFRIHIGKLFNRRRLC